MARIYLSGGPCNGRTVPDSEIVGGLVAYIACGGGYYTVDPNGRHHRGDLIFDYAGKTQPGPPGPTASTAPHAHKGWNDLQRSVNKKLPAAMSQSDKYAQAALRSLAKAHRVRV